MSEFFREFYVAVSPNGKYYTTRTRWIPEGDLTIIEETNNVKAADKFSSTEEIHDFQKRVELDDDPYYEGEFIIEHIRKIKVKEIYEVVDEQEIYVF